VAALTLSGEAEMVLTYDSLTPRPHPTSTPNVSVPVSVAGTSSDRFPHIVLLLSSGIYPCMHV
jgi:hypothetical protein